MSISVVIYTVLYLMLVTVHWNYEENPLNQQSEFEESFSKIIKNCMMALSISSLTFQFLFYFV